MAEYLSGYVDAAGSFGLYGPNLAGAFMPFDRISTIGLNAAECFVDIGFEVVAESEATPTLSGFADISYQFGLKVPGWAAGAVDITPAFGIHAISEQKSYLSGAVDISRLFSLKSALRPVETISGWMDVSGSLSLVGKVVGPVYLSGHVDIFPFLDLLAKAEGSIAAESYGYNLFLNHRTVAPLQIAYPFNSMGRVGATLYGAGSTGVFSVSGRTLPEDEDLSARFEFWVDLGARGRLRYVYLAGDFTENVSLTLTSDENIARTYTPAPRLSDNEHSFKFSIRRDNGQGRYWKLKFANAGGGIMSVDQISALPVVKAVR